MALVVLVLVVCVRAYGFHYVVDDAYISFRYAYNLVHHGELVFNPGERVEGVTNLLWTVVLAIPEALGWRTESFAQWLGTACGVATVLLTLAYGRRRRLNFAQAWWAALYVAALAPLPLWAQSGMETAPFALLFLATFWLGETCAGARGAVCLGAVATLAFAVRPEGALGFAFVALIGWREPEKRRYLVQAALVFAIGVLAITGVRLWYFGAIIPNTVAAKTSYLSILLPNGGKYVWRFTWHYLLIPFAALLLAAAREGRERWFIRATFTHPLVLVGLAFMLYVLRAGGDWMPYSRFLVPIMPLLAVAFVELAVGLGIDLGEPRSAAAAGVALLVLLVIEPHGGDYKRLVYNRDVLGPDLEVVTAALKAVPQRPSIALPVAGLIPYRTELPTIDLLGLSDRRIAESPPAPYRSLPGHHKINPGYVLDERRPDLIFINMGACVTKQPLGELKPWDLEQFLVAHPSFAQQYELGSLPANGWFVNAFRRRDRVLTGWMRAPLQTTGAAVPAESGDR